MKNVDVEIYVNQLISFFDKNPTDFMDLVGEEHRQLFYDKVKEQCYKNLENGEEIQLTRGQLIEIVVNIKKPEGKPQENEIQGILQKTKFGDIYLN